MRHLWFKSLKITTFQLTQPLQSNHVSSSLKEAPIYLLHAQKKRKEKNTFPFNATSTKRSSFLESKKKPPSIYYMLKKKKKRKKKGKTSSKSPPLTKL